MGEHSELIHVLTKHNKDMKIYSVHLSEDGLMTQVYTNIKALYNGLVDKGYTAETITMIDRPSDRNDTQGYKFTDVTFTYANLVKALRKSSENGKLYERVTINCERGNLMYVSEHPVVSK
jgi:hypothetical protein